MLSIILLIDKYHSYNTQLSSLCILYDNRLYQLFFDIAYYTYSTGIHVINVCPLPDHTPVFIVPLVTAPICPEPPPPPLAEVVLPPPPYQPPPPLPPLSVPDVVASPPRPKLPLFPPVPPALCVPPRPPTSTCSFLLESLPTLPPP